MNLFTRLQMTSSLHSEKKWNNLDQDFSSAFRLSMNRKWNHLLPYFELLDDLLSLNLIVVIHPFLTIFIYPFLYFAFLFAISYLNFLHESYLFPCFTVLVPSKSHLHILHQFHHHYGHVNWSLYSSLQVLVVHRHFCSPHLTINSLVKLEQDQTYSSWGFHAATEPSYSILGIAHGIYYVLLLL